MPMTWVISGVATAKDKNKSNLLAQDLLKICSNFLAFPRVIKRRKFTLPMRYQYQSMEVK